MTAPEPHTVVLLHGLGRTPASFWRMALMLRRAGFTCAMPGYLAWKGGHGTLAELIAQRLPQAGTLDFVGHSLGGLLALRLWQALPPERRGRVVQLGSPNLGSAAAERARALGSLVGPVLEELEPHDTPCEPCSALLAIAGTASLQVLSKVTGVEGANDGLVTVESALAAALPENRLILPVTHTMMMMDRRVIDATTDFLRGGALDPARAASGYA